jgi:hypothetical protein
MKTASYFDHLTTRPVRQIPDSDGLCSFHVVVAGEYVQDVSPRMMTSNPDKALAFLWPSSQMEAKFGELVKRWPWCAGATCVRGRP